VPYPGAFPQRRSPSLAPAPPQPNALTATHASGADHEIQHTTKPRPHHPLSQGKRQPLSEQAQPAPDPGTHAGRRNDAWGVPWTFRTADTYRIFTGKDGIKCQENTGSSRLSSAKKQPGWS